MLRLLNISRGHGNWDRPVSRQCSATGTWLSRILWTLAIKICFKLSSCGKRLIAYVSFLLIIVLVLVLRHSAVLWERLGFLFGILWFRLPLLFFSLKEIILTGRMNVASWFCLIPAEMVFSDMKTQRKLHRFLRFRWYKLMQIGDSLTWKWFSLVEKFALKISSAFNDK